MDFNEKESGIHKAAEFLLEYFTIRFNTAMQRVSEGRMLQSDPHKADVSIGKNNEALKTPRKQNLLLPLLLCGIKPVSSILQIELCKFHHHPSNLL